MKHIAMVVAVALLLAACSKEPSVDMKNASAEDVAKEVAKAGGTELLLQPGKWQTKVTVDEIDIPGMPASAQAQMEDVFKRQQNVAIDSCLTPEQARKPDGSFFSGKESANCRWERFTMNGGKVDGVMRCTGERDSAMTMKMSGNYTADSSTAQTEMTVETGQGTMTMKAHSEAKRIGECDGKEG